MLQICLLKFDNHKDHARDILDSGCNEDGLLSPMVYNLLRSFSRVLYESRVENSGGFSSIGKFFRSDAIVSFLISKYFLIQINQILAYHRNSFCFEISRM